MRHCLFIINYVADHRDLWGVYGSAFYYEVEFGLNVMVVSLFDEIYDGLSDFACIQYDLHYDTASRSTFSPRLM